MSLVSRSHASVRSRVVASVLVFVLAACGGGGDSKVTAPCTVSAVGVSPATVTVVAGATAQLTATPTMQNCTTTPSITWSSSASSVASVSGTGVVTGVGAGTATITATVGGASGSAVATVTPAPVATVTLASTTSSVGLGGTLQLTATLKDANGNTLTGRTVTWTSSAQGVATVNGSGLVSAVATGAATITATAEGVTGTRAITVVVALESSRFAVLWADQPAPAIGVPYTPVATSSQNGAGGANTVRRDGTGAYTVTLGRMAKGGNALNRESIFVTAYGTAGDFCRVDAWTDVNTTDLQVPVSCFDLFGAATNTAFTLAMIGSNTLAAGHAFLRNETAGGSATPDPLYTFTSGTGTVTSTRQNPGAYTAPAGFTTTAPVGAMVSTFGDPLRCYLGLVSSTPASVDARCSAVLSGAATDSRYTALVAEAGRAGRRWGFVRTTNANPAIGTPVTLNTSVVSAQSNGQAPSYTRDATGTYTLRFAGLGATAFSGVIIAAPYTIGAAGPGPCQVTGWSTSTGDLLVGVKCWSVQTRQPNDGTFTVFAIE